MAMWCRRIAIAVGTLPGRLPGIPPGIVLLVTTVVVSCGTPPPPGYYDGAHHNGTSGADYQNPGQGGILEGSVAVLGVVSAGSELRAFQRKNLANELESFVRAQRGYSAVLPYSQVQAALKSNAQQRLMLDRYTINGRLTEADWGILQASSLPVQFVIVARIDRDDTNELRPVTAPMKNSHGDTLSDRQLVTLFHQRSVEVAARMYDITTGDEVWAGAFVSEPANRTSYTEYTGSSFTGSMATLLTNSFVNGRAGKNYPSAPSSSEALREAFRSIATALTSRKNGASK